MKIKVRIWHKAHDRYLTDKEINEYRLQFIGGEIQTPGNLVVEMFTGFLDTNRKPIYANDLLKSGDMKKLAMVEWMAGSWRLRFESRHETTWRRLNAWRAWGSSRAEFVINLTIVGSYYQNQELINEDFLH